MATALTPQPMADSEASEVQARAPPGDGAPARAAPMFVRAQETEPKTDEVVVDNPDEIALPSDDEEEAAEVAEVERAIKKRAVSREDQTVIEEMEEEEEQGNGEDVEDDEIKTRAIPEELFGGLKSA